MTFGDLKIGNRFAARYSQGFTACNLYEKKSSKSAYDLRATEGGELQRYTYWEYWEPPHLNTTNFPSCAIVHKLESEAQQ